MVRVPDTQSIAVLFGEYADDAPADPPTFSELSPAEMDQLIIRCRRAIHSHRRESLSRDVETAETALAAIDSIQGLLRALLAIAPPEKRAKIEALLLA